MFHAKPGLALLQAFKDQLSNGVGVAQLADGLIGRDAEIEGPFGRKPLVYADYVASGRALMQVERFVLEQVLPFYANSHTEASFCGGFMTRLREEARSEIARCCGADEQHAVIFTGSGATAGPNRLVALLGITDAVAAGENPCVIIGPYEHHSNILPWRESGAEFIEIAEDANGGPDMADLKRALDRAGRHRLVVGSFSAASNVTGIVTDVAAVTYLLKAAGAKAVFNYAGGGPYLTPAMTPEPNAPIDAIVVSAHKFIGGPGASGILILRKDAAVMRKPTWPGGGTVKFVSAMGHDYSDNIAAREEAGTPNTIGDVRAALAFIVKEVIGKEWMAQRNQALVERANKGWANAVPTSYACYRSTRQAWKPSTTASLPATKRAWFRTAQLQRAFARRQGRLHHRIGGTGRTRSVEFSDSYDLNAQRAIFSLKAGDTVGHTGSSGLPAH